ncbi:MAG: hypothetical protein ACKO4L_07180, partial [Nodosilinea sp.]
MPGYLNRRHEELGLISRQDRAAGQGLLAYRRRARAIASRRVSLDSLPMAPSPSLHFAGCPCCNPTLHTT